MLLSSVEHLTVHFGFYLISMISRTVSFFFFFHLTRASLSCPLSDPDLGCNFGAELKERPLRELGEGLLGHRNERSWSRVEPPYWSLYNKTQKYITEKGPERPLAPAPLHR